MGKDTHVLIYVINCGLCIKDWKIFHQNFAQAKFVINMYMPNKQISITTL